LIVGRFYYCKIDPRSTTDSYGRQECTCSSLHISPGLGGEADGSPNLHREVDDVRSDQAGMRLLVVNAKMWNGVGKIKTEDMRTEFISFCSHGCSNVRRDLSNVGEGWEDRSRDKVLLCGLIS